MLSIFDLKWILYMQWLLVAENKFAKFGKKQIFNVAGSLILVIFLVIVSDTWQT